MAVFTVLYRPGYNKMPPFITTQIGKNLTRFPKSIHNRQFNSLIIEQYAYEDSVQSGLRSIKNKKMGVISAAAKSY